MRKLLVVALALFAFTGCRKKKEEGTVQKPTEGVTTGSAGSAAPAPEKTLTGADLAAKYQTCVGLINDAKFDDLKKQCLADSYVMHDYGETHNGADAAIAFFTAMKKAMPDWKLTPQIVVISGRNVYAVELITGSQSGPLEMPGLPAFPASGKKVGQLMFHKLAINDQNRATEEWAFDDPTTTMAQLGLSLLPKDAPPTRAASDKGLDGAPIVVVTADNDAEKKNLATWKTGADALNAHKIPDILAVVADKAVESDQTDAKDNVGKKEIEEGLRLFLGGFSDLKSTTSESVAAGDYVISIGRLEGTNDHDLGKLKKTGKKISLDVAEVSHFDKDGKVDHTWRFHSGMQAAMEMGLLTIPVPTGAGSAAPAAGSAAPTMAPATGSAAPAAGSAAPAAGSAAPAAPASAGSAAAPAKT